MKKSLALKPCDCIDEVQTKMLESQGIGFNDDSILVRPNSVILKMGHTEIKIPMHLFKRFAEWYLRPQEIDEKHRGTLRSYEKSDDTSSI